MGLPPVHPPSVNDRNVGTRSLDGADYPQSIDSGGKFELIGSQGGVVTEMDTLDEDFKRFRVDI